MKTAHQQSKDRKHSIRFDRSSPLTQQHQKDETDINLIMARYTRTGVIDHVNKNQPAYFDVPAHSYHEAQNAIAQADSMFQELPAKARKYFDNDPSKFLSFVQNPKNADKLFDMGLSNTPMSPPSDNPPDLPPVKPTEPKPPAKTPAAASTEPAADA